MRQEWKENIKREAEPPKTIFAEAGIRQDDKLPIFETTNRISSENIENFLASDKLVESAARFLRKQGFDILHKSPISITIGGERETYNSVFETKIVQVEREVIKECCKKEVAQCWDCEDETDLDQFIDTRKLPLKDIIAGVAIEEKFYFYNASPLPPSKDYWHLNVPTKVSEILNAEQVHDDGFTGQGIRVVMVDSGWYRHPYFDDQGYRINPVVLGPGTSNPEIDENGHGTGESANVFAIAPDIDFTMVKMDQVLSVGAFDTAVGLNPDIITCSWGTTRRKEKSLTATDRAHAASVAHAVFEGITVVFAAGNGHFGFPGQHPDAISAGGVYMCEHGTFKASNYASGFRSEIYSRRNVPDVCGLVGENPRAIYIMLPVQENCWIDSTFGCGTYPEGDETANNDGWAVFSGTSAASPQIAGICALMKQANSNLTPITIKRILKQTAIDVTNGECSWITGPFPATRGPDLATGHGLADAYRAVLLAQQQW